MVSSRSILASMRTKTIVVEALRPSVPLRELVEDLGWNADWPTLYRRASARSRRVPRVVLSDTASPDCLRADDRTAA